MTIDYQKILKAYIRHVQDCEGTDFLYGSHGQPKGLNDEEIELLLRLHDAVHIELEDADNA